MLGANTHCSVFRLLVCEDHPPCFCFLLLESLQKVWAQEKEWGLASYRATQLGLDWCQRSSCLFLSANLRLISWQSLICPSISLVRDSLHVSQFGCWGRGGGEERNEFSWHHACPRHHLWLCGGPMAVSVGTGHPRG